MLWSRYRDFAGLTADEVKAGNPLLQEITQPGVGTLLAPRSPLYLEGTGPARPAPDLGADTAQVLGEFLGLSAAQARDLEERGVAGG